MAPLGLVRPVAQVALASQQQQEVLEVPGAVAAAVVAAVVAVAAVGASNHCARPSAAQRGRLRARKRTTRVWTPPRPTARQEATFSWRQWTSPNR